MDYESEMRSLRARRQDLVEEQRNIVNLADQENREFTKSEKERFDKIEKDFHNLGFEMNMLESRHEVGTVPVIRAELDGGVKTVETLGMTVI